MLFIKFWYFNYDCVVLFRCTSSHEYDIQRTFFSKSSKDWTSNTNFLTVLSAFHTFTAFMLCKEQEQRIKFTVIVAN